jgi:chemotaxis protein CheD
MSNLLVVGISDYKIAKNPNVLVTYALGSCVGICLYDKILKIGALSHIMLPDSNLFSRQEVNRMKFADTAIYDMLNALVRNGASQRRIIAKIAGGAQMFQMQGESQLGVIGARNVKSVKGVLGHLQIPIIAEDTGSNYGRTVYFELETGVMRVQSLSRDVKEF